MPAPEPARQSCQSDVQPPRQSDDPGCLCDHGAAARGLSKWAATVGFDVSTPVGTGDILLHGDWSYRSSYNADTTNSQYTQIGGYGVVNASVGYRFNSSWEVDAFVRNLFDENYVTALTVQTGNSGLILGQTGDPRLVGVTLRVRR
uniref:TonB-dependent receptor n=1 Tax=Phenylobacterium glaciei TaxID=2803784 RepID=A0A974P0Y7_9CAUL|nr:TonB-dependent receptor [Phenylobacterium glaciei]